MSPQKENRHSDADQRILDTAERLIEIYKKEFGSDWQRLYAETVVIDVGQI